MHCLNLSFTENACGQLNDCVCFFVVAFQIAGKFNFSNINIFENFHKQVFSNSIFCMICF